MCGFFRCKEIYGREFEFFYDFVEWKSKNILYCKEYYCFCLEGNWNKMRRVE